MQRLTGMRVRRGMLAVAAIASVTATISIGVNPTWGQTPVSDLRLPWHQHLAQSLSRDYQPPPTSTPPRRSTVGGTRGGGCRRDAPISLTVLAPKDHIGQTASIRPTMVWYVPDEQPYDMQLQLYRYTSTDPEDEQIEPVKFFDLGPSQQGYMTFTLPAEEPALVPGETYRWQVIIVCQPGQPSRDQVDVAEFKVVDQLTEVDEAIAADPVTRAEQYVAAGLWYDAIAVLSQEPVSPAAAAYRSELLSSLAGLEMANPNDGPPSNKFSDRLRYIAENAL